MEQQMSAPYFPVGVNEMKAKREFFAIDEGRVRIDDNVTVETKWLNHPQGCLGYRIESPEGVKNINNVNSKLKAATSWHSIYGVELVHAYIVESARK